MTAAASLTTGVAGSHAEAPGPPERWSYSALTTASACPRRYALERADYPELWDRHGYPPLPGNAALFGNVVHAALETVMRALAAAGAPSPNTAEAVAVLRALGGLTAAVESAAAGQLSALEDNPRLNAAAHARLTRQLLARTSEARAQVQSYLSRTPFAARASTAAGTSTTAGSSANAGSAPPPGGWHRRPALGQGSHAEVRLAADNLRLQGRIDLLTIRGDSVEIVDYKTGAPSPGHSDQLRLYALLWASDETANPAHLPAATLTAAYPDHDVRIDPLEPQQLSHFAQAVAAQVAAADREQRSDAPLAKPSAQNCPRCPVRHLCPEYWEHTAALPAAEDGWLDLEATIGVQNGPRSWWTHRARGGPDVLLRTDSTSAPFRTGDRLRLLGLRTEADPDMVAPVAKVTALTEIFRLEEPPHSVDEGDSGATGAG